MSSKVYSANEVSCIVGVIPIDSGRGDDEFLSITKEEDTFTVKTGVDGEATFSENKNNVHRVKITVMQTSSANALLSAIHLGDIKVAGGAGIVPLMVRDKQGLDLFVATEARIVKWPDLAYAKDAGTVQWELICPNPERFIGGHP